MLPTAALLANRRLMFFVVTTPVISLSFQSFDHFPVLAPFRLCFPTALAANLKSVAVIGNATGQWSDRMLLCCNGLENYTVHLFPPSTKLSKAIVQGGSGSDAHSNCLGKMCSQATSLPGPRGCAVPKTSNAIYGLS